MHFLWKATPERYFSVTQLKNDRIALKSVWLETLDNNLWNSGIISDLRNSKKNDYKNISKVDEFSPCTFSMESNARTWIFIRWSIYPLDESKLRDKKSKSFISGQRNIIFQILNQSKKESISKINFRCFLGQNEHVWAS